MTARSRKRLCAAQHANLESAADVKAFVEARRSEFDAIVAAARVQQRGGEGAGRGHRDGGGVPEYAAVAGMFQERCAGAVWATP